jgi:peptidoglycan/LPS O-acetylase OafA/YrhL
VPLSFWGRRCYSLYLLHGPIVELLKWNLFRWGVTSNAGTLLVTVPVCMVAALVPSALFHHFVEQRFANPPRPPTRSGTASGADAVRL